MNAKVEEIYEEGPTCYCIWYMTLTHASNRKTCKVVALFLTWDNVGAAIALLRPTFWIRVFATLLAPKMQRFDEAYDTRNAV